MCYLARHQQAMPGKGHATAPTDTGQHRPRWAGVGAAVLVAGLSVAAVLVPPAVPPVSADEAQGVVATVASAVAPATAPAQVVEQVRITTTLDDGTPTPTEAARSVGGACAHDM
ncbi:hypothetical protein [Ramlibacter sp.]|uniref:hypothetical protein n=1 Tax=Ramlibacter sp. TaxID=1917967 RepID=UPI002D334652|nr:hypothetical protein [Ramlibacter sp.]HYD76058.1 hypothetical protein [Ramlibacter sp.]